MPTAAAGAPASAPQLILAPYTAQLEGSRSGSGAPSNPREAGESERKW